MQCLYMKTASMHVKCFLVIIHILRDPDFLNGTYFTYVVHYSANFMNVDVYFKQLKFQKVKQIKAYEIQQFLSKYQII